MDHRPAVGVEPPPAGPLVHQGGDRLIRRQQGPGDIVVLERLVERHRVRPHDGVVPGEEGVAVKCAHTTHRFIIDPIDGTTNFMHGIPHFAISIGLEREGQMVSGVSYNPVTDDLYTAEKGHGAYLNNKRLRVAARKELAHGVHEIPDGSNRAPAIYRYDLATTPHYYGAPWCAYFASYIARRAGVPIGPGGHGLGYVPSIRAWAQASGKWTQRPRPGELITFPEHVGVVEAVYPSSHTLTSIEGNYSNGVHRVWHRPVRLLTVNERNEAVELTA